MTVLVSFISRLAYRSVPVPDLRFDVRHDAGEYALPYVQWFAAQLLPVECEKIERHEVRPLSTEQQVVEVATPVGPEADDLPVEHR